MRAGYDQTRIGRSYATLQEWWEREQVRGIWNGQGVPWESHPSWTIPADRENWHRNWGELLNSHTTAHIRTFNSGGVVVRRLRVRVSHPDLTRLELVKSVTGGTIEAGNDFRTIHRLTIETLGAFLALKAGRCYVDPANSGLFDVLDAAMDFYQYVPERGQPPSDEQVAGQEATADRLDTLIGAYIGAKRAPHLCQEGIEHAGTADWGAPVGPTEAPRHF